MLARRTAAFLLPAAHSVRAAPGGLLADPNLVPGRMFRQVFRVVGQADIALPVDAGEEAGEDPVAPARPADRDRVRRGAVVEEEGEAGAGGKPRLIGPPRVESLGRRLPDGFSALAPLESLVRREDRESDAELRH